MIKPDELDVDTVLHATRTVTESDIERCAELTGDFGIHHVAGMAGRRVAQGLLTVAAAPLLRGDPGFRLQSMSLTFLAPVHAGETITATVRIESVEPTNDGGRRIALALAVQNQDQVDVVTGAGTGIVAQPTD